MNKLAVGLLVLISLMTTTNQLSCYIGEQEIARLQDGFDSCVSNMDVMTYEVYYEGVVSSFKSYNSTGTAGTGRQNSCAAQMIAGNFTEIKCYCYYDSCNKLLNLHEFAGELNATLERSKKFSA
ncbi:unnamed protein product [Caenorhabditis brenneri]